MTIYDIACKAGVSTATVSRVLNHTGRVSEESRRKVEEVIAREGFIPNAFAHSLTTKRSHTIGMICPVISDANHAYPVAELTGQLRENGFEVLLISTGSNTESKRAGFASLINHQAEAAVVIGCSEDEQEAEDFRYAAARLPVFIVNGRVEGENIYSILCDEEAGACGMVKRLADMGRRQIPYLYDSDTYSGHCKRRGYEEGMRRYTGEEPFTVRIVGEETSSFFQTKETVSRLLAGRPFDAVLSADDSLAIGAAKALREAGRDPVPMIGFNNTVLGRCATPELSSFDIDMKQLCRLTVRTLLDVLQGQTAPSCLKLEGKLVERASLLDFES